MLVKCDPIKAEDWNRETKQSFLDGPMASHETEVIDFEHLTTKLIELEKENGISTLEVFRQYINDDFGGNRAMQKWFGLFFLYLGTEEVRRFSYP